MKPGRELDEIVAEKVMGWKRLSDPTYDWHSPDDGLLAAGMVPFYSTDIAAAWRIVSKLAPVVGDFHEADGYFIVQYGDSADHVVEGMGGGCAPGPIVTTQTDNDDGEDLERWSAHFHPGHAAAETESEKLFPDYKKYCARGETAAHAICLAALAVTRAAGENKK